MTAHRSAPAATTQHRLPHVDFLRAVAIIVMIAAHVLSRNLGTILTNTTWNYTHFAMVLFLFCSGYLFYRQTATIIWSPRTYLTWIKKRALRLVGPYYGFLSLHFILWYVFPRLFSGLGLTKSADFVLSSIIFRGVDYGWLPLLFLEIMLVSPMLLMLYRSKTTKAGTILLFFVSTVIFLFYPRQGMDYRLVMWVPWSFIVLMSFRYAELEQSASKTRAVITTGAAAAVLFALGSAAFPSFRLPLTLTLHKYPPDIWFLSYGIAVGSILLFAAPARILNTGYVRTAIRWISIHSYQLFYIHYIMTDIVKTIHPETGLPHQITLQFLIVLGASMGVIAAYEKLTDVYRYHSGS